VSSRSIRLHDVMAGFVERGEIPGIVTLVSRRGEPRIDAVGTLAFGSSAPMREDTIFRISSMSKPVTAVATLMLVEECVLRLDEPVDRLLPELADRKVLRSPTGPLEDTVPANRPLTLRDLLTLRQGFGYLMDSWDSHPIQRAAHSAGFVLGPPRPQQPPAPDEWLRNFATLPLMHQPGERWMYDLGIELLSVLVARASGQPFDVFLRERIFEPLGMKDTGFSVPTEKLPRFATEYWTSFKTRKMEVFDEPATGDWSKPPAFPSGAGGLVSTVSDYFAFSEMLLNKGLIGGGVSSGRASGRSEGRRLLASSTVEAMTTNQLTPEQLEGTDIFLGGNRGWGLGISMITHRDGPASNPGRYGWDGGLGTSWNADPQHHLTGILMTQVAWTSPVPPRVADDFWTLVYQALDD
jgi:CubicO group peptidase (beta-lactamase class C family)